MAILSKDEYFTRLTGYIGDSNSDEDISFFEDMTDTFNEMEKKSKGDGVDWEQKAKDIDAAWRKKYTSRFFRGDSGEYSPDDGGCGQTREKSPDEITFDDLFRKKEG